MNNVMAEQLTLSGILKYRDAFEEVEDLLDANCFSEPIHGIVWNCAKHFYGNNETDTLEFGTLLSTANALSLTQDVTVDAKYIRTLFNFPIERENVFAEATKVKKISIINEYSTQLRITDKNIQRLTGEEDISEIVAIAEKDIMEYTDSILYIQQSEIENFAETIDDYVQFLKEHPVEKLGIPTGFQIWDNSIGDGLTSGVHVVAARAKTGKTSLGVTVSVNVIGDGFPVLYVDTEMDTGDVKCKMIANLTALDWIKVIKKGQFTNSPKDLEKVEEARQFIKESYFSYVSIRSNPHEATLAKIKRWLKRKVGFKEDGTANKCLIIFDYLKLMSNKEINSNTNESQALGFFMTKLHDFMKKYDVPCLAFAQMNREGLENDTIKALAASDRLTWFCTSLTYFKPLDTDEINRQQGNREIYRHKLIPLLGRCGPALEDGEYIYVKFHKSCSRIVEGPLYSPEEDNEVRL